MIPDLWVALHYIYIYHALFRTRDFLKHFYETRPVSVFCGNFRFCGKVAGRGRGKERIRESFAGGEEEGEGERNLQRANDESSNIFNLYVYIYIYIFICEKKYTNK